MQDQNGWQPAGFTEETLAIIKPDAVRRLVVGRIITMVEESCFEIVAMSLFAPIGVNWWKKFYAEHDGKPFFEDLCSFMASGPVVGLVLRGENAVSKWRELVGATDVKKANPGTVRWRYGTTDGPMYKNAVHGSDSAESAKREIDMLRSLRKVLTSEPQ